MTPAIDIRITDPNDVPEGKGPLQYTLELVWQVWSTPTSNVDDVPTDEENVFIKK